MLIDVGAVKALDPRVNHDRAEERKSGLQTGRVAQVDDGDDDDCDWD